MAQPPFNTPPHPDIPRFEPDLTKRAFSWRPPFQSPTNGRIVELMPGVFHAHPIEEDMLDGTRLNIVDFQSAALDSGFVVQIGTRAFALIYYQLFFETEQAIDRHGWESPYYAYHAWGSSENPTRRSQLLLSSQATWDIYTDIREATPEKRRGSDKFLRIVETLFDAREPNIFEEMFNSPDLDNE